MAQRRPVGVDLFAGAGGLSLGFEQAGFDVVAAVELDPVHCATHEFNFPKTATICGSVTELSGDEIRRRAGIGRTKVDVVFGGSPCQGFSLIGKRALDDPRNELVRHFVRIVAELKASYFVFENVKGLTVGQHKQLLVELVEEMTANGYNVVLPWQVLNASSYGVPQSRERLFLIGARKGLRMPRYPEPISRAAGSRGNGRNLPPGPSVQDALGDIPDAEQFTDLVSSDTTKVKWGRPSAYARILRGLSNAEDYGYRRAYNSTLLTSSLRTEHTPLSRKRFAATRGGEVEPVSRFFKLPLDGVSNTLRAGTDSARGAFTSPRPIHPIYPRCATVREMARLHSFPDWFRFHVTKWHGARQIGNAVAPFVARAVAEEIIQALRVEPTTPTEVVKLGDERLLRMDMSEAAAYYGIDVPIAQRVRKDSVQRRPRPRGRGTDAVAAE